MRFATLRLQPSTPYNERSQLSCLQGVYGAVPISLNDVSRRWDKALLILAALIIGGLLWSGCGQTYRPIANPIPLPGGNPQATHFALVVNQNPPTPGQTASPGSVTQIDVSGDTNIANLTAGLNPVHGALNASLSTGYIVNRGDSTLTGYTPALGASSSVVTIPLLQNSMEPNAGASYVALSSLYAFVVETSLNRLAVVTNALFQVAAFVPVGADPVAVTCTSDGRKAYVANQGSNTVSVVSTKDFTNSKNIAVGASPEAITISTDNNYVFVANAGDGTVSVINTTSDTVQQTVNVGADPTQVIFDNSLTRVYVLNTGGNSVSIFSASTYPLTLLQTVSTSSTPVSLAVLDNGTKFYVLFQGTPGSVEVYDAQGFFKRTTVTVGNNTLPTGMPTVNQVLLAASPGSTKVYAVNFDGDPVNTSGSTSIIRTLDDTVVLNMPAALPHPTFVTAQ